MKTYWYFGNNKTPVIKNTDKGLIISANDLYRKVRYQRKEYYIQSVEHFLCLCVNCRFKPTHNTTKIYCKINKGIIYLKKTQSYEDFTCDDKSGNDCYFFTRYINEVKQCSNKCETGKVFIQITEKEYHKEVVKNEKRDI